MMFPPDIWIKFPPAETNLTPGPRLASEDWGRTTWALGPEPTTLICWYCWPPKVIGDRLCALEMLPVAMRGVVETKPDRCSTDD